VNTRFNVRLVSLGDAGALPAVLAATHWAELTDNIVDRALTIDRRGALRSRAKAEFEISYRHCALKEGGRIGEDEWFVAAYFKLAEGDGEASRAKIRDYLSRRVASQPLSLPNAGSVFRNPIGDHAARLIESCGLKGLARGGARVSEKHANFIVNPKGAASAADIEWLIGSVRNTVREKTGIDLRPEVLIVGDA
jgi:UDP-N-acetylmuramate dehydrogenase